MWPTGVRHVRLDRLAEQAVFTPGACGYDHARRRQRRRVLHDYALRRRLHLYAPHPFHFLSLRSPIFTRIYSDAAIAFTIGSSTVFLDQSYWQRAIASDPRGTTRAYFLGGLSWFSVPFAFGTIMGLSARALQDNPAFPTYPEPLSAAQQGAGLVAPAAAVVLLGRSGAIAMLIVTYMVRAPTIKSLTSALTDSRRQSLLQPQRSSSRSRQSSLTTSTG